MGLKFEKHPLHQKDVSTIVLRELDKLKVDDEALSERWRRVRKWITVAPKDVHRGRPVQARMTSDEVAIMVT